MPLNKPFLGRLGKNTFVSHPFMFVNKKHVYFGDNVQVRDFARIEPVVKRGNQSFNPKIIFGNNVSIEQGLHLTCAEYVEIKANCVLSSYCMLTDISHEYGNVNESVLSQPLLVKPTILDEGCFIGTGAKIMPGVHLGKHCVVGANAVVTKSFPDYSVIAGIPAVLIKKFNPNTNSWEKV